MSRDVGSAFRRNLLFWLAGGLLFIILATANGAGYRYGASDQAFYIPVVIRALDPSAFPRDRTLIDAQGRLMLVDEILAAVMKGTGASLETVFFAAYLVSLALVWAAVVIIGRQVYRSAWLTIALGAALTLRHQIPRTSANSLEPYFHPRILAFGVCLLAIGAVLKRRPFLAIALVAVSAAIHITTALWFAIVIGVALVVTNPGLRRLAVPALVSIAIVLTWALVSGPLHTSLTTMDATWLNAVAGKDSLFATAWPAWAWVANLGLLAIVWLAHAYRSRHHASTREDAGLVWGATALVALFIAALPLVAARVAFPVQLQMPRVFWIVDVLATIYLLALAAPPRGTSGPPSGGPITHARMRLDMIAAVVLVVISISRGAYVMAIEHPERRLYPTAQADSPWEDAMRWLSQQPIDRHVLADPGHAWKYGTSVRVSAGRDVFLDDVKDAAVAIYSRDVAARVVERTAAIGDFDRLDAPHARELAARYELDYLVTTMPLDLPVAHRNAEFVVYALR